jgi:hypothetical protein
LESSKRKHKTSERISDVELQAASGLAQMSHKKLKEAVKKVSSSGVRRVPSAFDDDLFVGADSQKGSCFWPLLRFNFRDNCPSGSENEFVDIDSFSDAAPEVRKEVVLVIAAEAPVVAGTLAAVEVPSAAETIAAVEVPLLMSLCPLAPATRLPLNSPRSLNSPYKGGRILSNALPCSKFGKLFPKIRPLLLPWLHLTRASVRLIAASY